MTILRLTAKLQKRLRLKPADLISEDALRNEGKLGEWSCNLLNIGRFQTILCVHHTTRFPIFLPAADAQTFPSRLQDTLRRALPFTGGTATEVMEATSYLNTVQFAKTNDRSVLGSLVDYKRCADVYELTNDDLFPLSLQIAEMPLGSKIDKTLGYNPITRMSNLLTTTDK